MIPMSSLETHRCVLEEGYLNMSVIFIPMTDEDMSLYFQLLYKCTHLFIYFLTKMITLLLNIHILRPFPISPVKDVYGRTVK